MVLSGRPSPAVLEIDEATPQTTPQSSPATAAWVFTATTWQGASPASVFMRDLPPACRIGAVKPQQHLAANASSSPFSFSAERVTVPAAPKQADASELEVEPQASRCGTSGVTVGIASHPGAKRVLGTAPGNWNQPACARQQLSTAPIYQKHCWLPEAKQVAYVPVPAGCAPSRSRFTSPPPTLLSTNPAFQRQVLTSKA